jgi:pimeloyl-ACP methyl ester carboxylesterase
MRSCCSLRSARRITVAPAETLTVELWGVSSGPVVVLIADFLGSAFTFRHVALALADAGYHVIVVEPLAVGTSSRPRKADYSLSAQALRVAAVLDSCGVTSAIVGAQGTNSAIAARLAAAWGDRVLRLVLLEGGGADRAAGPGFRRAIQNLPGLQLLGLGVMRRTIRKAMISASSDASWVTDEVVAEYTRGAAVDLDATFDAYRAIARAKEPDDIADRLDEIRVPVRLLLGGAKHGAAPPRNEVQLLAARLTALTIEAVPGAGHHLAEERPDRVIEALIGGPPLNASVVSP